MNAPAQETPDQAAPSEAAPSEANSSANSYRPNPYRLSRNVIPVRYDLTLEPDLASATFKGEVVISVTLLGGDPTNGNSPSESITAITLNAAELEIFEAKIIQSGQTHPAAVTLDEKTERATFQIEPGLLSPGEAQIACKFTGVLNDKLRGFYRSTYTASSTGSSAVSDPATSSSTDEQGRTIATTQFESTNARRAFPCFDEPDFKAVFGVTLVVRERLTAISCGELLSVDPADEPGYSSYRFADTMVMSTYLLAFIVGELEATEPVDVGGVPLRIVHVPGKSHLTQFAIEVGSFALSWLVDYYGIAYPGKKLDLVAVPDFAFGAMENMGCVTFRETLLLADPDASTLAELTRIVDVVAHEIAHMWFGNLVTMDWWNGIWLKEAFATFMQMSTTHAFRPQWCRWDEFSLERGAAFDVDSLSSTRPIEFDVVSPEDAEGMYDLLTYEKGASVVRMLEQYLGPDEFRAGVKHYLETFSYRNVTTTDLWEALEAATGQPVAAAMETWIFKGGYPILDVSADKNGVVLRQRRFTYGAGASSSGSSPGAGSTASIVAGSTATGSIVVGSTVAGSTNTDQAAQSAQSVQTALQGELWHVPVTIRAQQKTGELVERRVLLTEAEMKIDLGGACEWVTANAGGHGYYRARYSPELLTPLTQRALDVLSPVERYALVDDAFAAVLADQTSATEFVELATSLATAETDLRVWQRILSGLKALYLVSGTDDRSYLSQLTRDLSTTALGVVGFEPVAGESDLERELRAVLFSAAGVEGQDEFVRRQASALFIRANDDSSATEPVEPNLATAALNVVAASGDADDYDHILDLYRNASTPQSEQNYLWSLLQFRSQELFDRTLTLARDEVRTQNSPFLLAAAMSHIDLGPRAWAFVSGHWAELCRRFPQNTISRMVGGVRAMSTPALAREVTEFFEENKVPQGELIVAQHIEKMWVNVALRERLNLTQ